MMGITSIIEIIIFLPLIFTVPLPTTSIWFFIFATTFLHGLYRYSVVKSYQYGDLSFVYPIARGGSVLIIGLISIIILNVDLNLAGFLGIILICLGKLLPPSKPFTKSIPSPVIFRLGAMTAVFLFTKLI